MPRYELELRLDAPDAADFGGAITEESARVRTRIYRELHLKVYSNAWVSIDLSSPKGMNNIQKLREVCTAGQVRAGTGHLHERIEEGESAAADWFCLFTRSANDSFSLWDDYPSYKMSDLGAEHAYCNSFVSADFVDICERSGLRGISYLRCQKKGRKPGPAWFVALPDSSLGRGLDHHWFDRPEWLRYVGDDPKKRSASPGAGQYGFHQSFLRVDRAKGTQFLQPLLDMFPMSRAHDSTLLGLNFVTVPRFWTGAFPEADFAFALEGEDGPNRDGKAMRFRQLMVSRHARQVLIDAGLFAGKVFLAVRSVASPEEGVEILDQSHACLPPMYTDEELAELRSREKALLAT